MTVVAETEFLSDFIETLNITSDITRLTNMSYPYNYPYAYPYACDV